MTVIIDNDNDNDNDNSDIYAEELQYQSWTNTLSYSLFF